MVELPPPPEVMPVAAWAKVLRRSTALPLGFVVALVDLLPQGAVLVVFFVIALLAEAVGRGSKCIVLFVRLLALGVVLSSFDVHLVRQSDQSDAEKYREAEEGAEVKHSEPELRRNLCQLAHQPLGQ